MAYRISKMIVMVGLMGAGKTAVGTLVAQKLGVPFLDSDQEIVKAANMSIAEIFSRDGEAFFRAKETQVLARLLQEQSGVLSTGGGAYLSQTNRDLVSLLGIAVWLRADLELLWARVRHKDTRPLLRVPDPFSKLSQLYLERTPLYDQAEIAVDAQAGLSLEQMSQKVITALVADPRSGVREIK